MKAFDSSITGHLGSVPHALNIVNKPMVEATNLMAVVRGYGRKRPVFVNQRVATSARELDINSTDKRTKFSLRGSWDSGSFADDTSMIAAFTGLIAG
jgi:hypothetical protein